MGQDKASLDWHGTPLVVRVAGLVRRAVDGPVVVVAAPGQELPALPPGVEVVRDPEPGLGPLAGIANGLASIGDRADTAFVTATDMPFLHPALIRRVAALLDGADAAVPFLAGRTQPLTSVFRCAVAAERAGQLLARGERRLGALVESLTVRSPSEDTLLADPVVARLDPDLASVRSLDLADAYAEAVGQPAPAVALETRAGRSTVRAWTLAGALGHVVLAVTVDGRTWPPDRPVPLAEGDEVVVADSRATVRGAS